MVDHADDYGTPPHDADRYPAPRLGSLRLRRRPGRRARRLLVSVLAIVITLCLFGAVGIGLFFLRLSEGPITIAFERQIESALTKRVGHGLRFSVAGTSLTAADGRPVLVLNELALKDGEGRAIVRAPQASVSADPIDMMSGTLAPSRLELQGVTLRLAILEDGGIALTAGTDEALPLRIADIMAGADKAVDSGSAVQPGQPGETPPLAGNKTLREGTPLAGASPGPQDEAKWLAVIVGNIVDKLTGVDSALGAINRLGVQHGTLVLDDRPHGIVRTFRNLELNFDKLAAGATKLTISADGASGRWTLGLRGARQDDGRRTLTVDMDNITLDDVRSLPAVPDLGFDSDMAVTLNLDFGLEASGRLSVAHGRISAGEGYLRLNDPDHEPVLIDAISTAFHFDADKAVIDIDPSSIAAGETHFDFSGSVTPPAGTASAWTIAGAAKGVFGTERPGEHPIALSQIALQAHVTPADGSVVIDSFRLGGPEVDMGLKAAFLKGPNGLTVKAHLAAGRMPAPVLLRLWPSLVSANVRAWFLANLKSGTVDSGTLDATLDGDDFARIKAERPVQDSHLHLEYAVSDVVLAFMDGVPPAHIGQGQGVVTGVTSRFDAGHGSLDVAPDRSLAIVDGSFVVPNTDQKPAPATLTLHINGGVDVLTELLQRDALKSFANLPAQANTAKGQIDGTLTVGLKLGPHVPKDDVKIGASAQLSSFTLEHAVGQQNLTNGAIALTLDKNGLRAKGDARIFDTPVSLDLRKPGNAGPTEASFTVTLDDAARAKAGLTFGKVISGPVGVKVSTVLGGDNAKTGIELDLTKAALANVAPGISKAAGKPGKASLTLVPRDKGMLIDNISCDFGSVSARGAAELDGSGDLQSLKLSQFRLSPGDDMSLVASQSGDALKVTVKAANLDARPFIKSFSSPDTGKDSDGKDVDLDLHANVLTGQNSQSLTNVDLRLIRRGGQIRRVQMTGRAGRAPMTVNGSPQGTGTVVVVNSGDAGVTLSFLDLYKRVGGGVLEANLRLTDGRIDGYATMRDFSLREDPAMKRLTEESYVQSKSAYKQPIDADKVTFQKLFILFTKTGSRVDVRDGAMVSPDMGATVQGSIDFGRDRLALSGTFVPAYGVNNLFSQLPLLGPILGGGANEGLFGLNYKIGGSIAAPALTVDPLSALAPGFLRKVFGAISDATEQNVAPGPEGSQASGTPKDLQAR